MARKTKGQSRTARRDKLMAAAAQTHVPSDVDICVMGGGAAGLVAATTAAEAGARVVVLERDLACGRTILATGNGRCNFANERLDPTQYTNGAFVQDVCGATWLADVLAFFADCGLAWTTESQGRMYPLSRQAASVRNVLLDRAQRAGVVLAPLREVVGVKAANGSFNVTYREAFGDKCDRSVLASRVVVATGGGTTLVADSLGVRDVPIEQVLCPLSCSGPGLRALDGRRVQACASLYRDGQLIMREEGEVLFRTFGLSGIVVFNLSRHARPNDEIALDLLGHLSPDQTQQLTRHTLDGVLDPIIAHVLLDEAGSAGKALARAKDLRYTVRGRTETSHAQVHRGGLATDEFDANTLSARRFLGLYACGEALDVDGPCGGYNLAWAWKSGLVAGNAAAKGARP